ncbi:MAG TPA: YfbK domain-containing protein, partial [Thermoanaerobaculia bacterium]|nr:YfbK domain-containing protein [Thermoanaerobaculia bacterium]
EDFENDEKDAGELGAGHSVTALYEFTPASNARGTIATVKLRYKEPRGLVSKLLTVAAVDDGRSAFGASPDMQFAAAVAELGMLLRDSPHKGTASFAEVLQLARVARGEDLDGLREEFLRLTESARALTQRHVAAQ